MKGRAYNNLEKKVLVEFSKYQFGNGTNGHRIRKSKLKNGEQSENFLTWLVFDMDPRPTCNVSIFTVKISSSVSRWTGRVGRVKSIPIFQNSLTRIIFNNAKTMWCMREILLVCTIKWWNWSLVILYSWKDTIVGFPSYK